MTVMTGQIKEANEAVVKENLETNVMVIDENVETKKPVAKIISLEEFKEEVSKFLLLEVSKDEMSVSQFVERLSVFLFNDPIQRNIVWDIEKKSKLIASILEDVSIGEIKVEIIRRSKKRFRNVLDGKQRLTTIRDFLLNKFGLSEGTLVELVDADGNIVNIDLSGAKYEDLPEVFKNKITALILDIKGYEDLTEEKKAELFKRWNNGEALTPTQLRKAKLPLNILVSLASLKSKPVFQAGFSEKSLTKENNQDMLLKAMMVIHSDNNTSLTSKDIDTFINMLNDDILYEFVTLVPYAESVFENIESESVKRKAFGVAKTISFMWVIKHAYTNQISTKSVAKWVEAFVDEAADLGYNAKSSTTSKEKVIERNAIALNHFNQFSI